MAWQHVNGHLFSELAKHAVSFLKACWNVTQLLCVIDAATNYQLLHSFGKLQIFPFLIPCKQEINSTVASVDILIR